MKIIILHVSGQIWDNPPVALNRMMICAGPQHIRKADIKHNTKIDNILISLVWSELKVVHFSEFINLDSP